MACLRSADGSHLRNVVWAAGAAPFIRFHEYWAAFAAAKLPQPAKPGQTSGASMCHNLVKTATEETQKYGIGLSVGNVESNGKKSRVVASACVQYPISFSCSSFSCIGLLLFSDIVMKAHSGNYTSESSLELGFALFMLVRNAKEGEHEDYFGWSTSQYWFTKDWDWNATANLFTHSWGNASGPMVVNPASGVYSRQYDGGNVEVNCESLKANISMV